MIRKAKIFVDGHKSGGAVTRLAPDLLFLEAIGGVMLDQ